MNVPLTVAPTWTGTMILARCIPRSAEWKFQSPSSCSLALFLLLSAVGLAQAQQPVPSGPQAPSDNERKPFSPDLLKNDRIFGVIPNYRTVEDPTQRIKPLTTKQKFRLAVDDSFDPYAYPIAGAFAAVGQAHNDPRSWGQGWGAFAKRYAAAFADQTSENMMVEAVVPTLLKQDPRYFRVEQGGFFKRTGYCEPDLGHAHRRRPQELQSLGDWGCRNLGEPLERLLPPRKPYSFEDAQPLGYPGRRRYTL